MFLCPLHWPENRGNSKYNSLANVHNKSHKQFKKVDSMQIKKRRKVSNNNFIFCDCLFCERQRCQGNFHLLLFRGSEGKGLFKKYSTIIVTVLLTYLHLVLTRSVDAEK